MMLHELPWAPHGPHWLRASIGADMIIVYQRITDSAPRGTTQLGNYEIGSALKSYTDLEPLVAQCVLLELLKEETKCGASSGS